MDAVKKILSVLWMPLFGLLALLSFYVVWKFLNLPSEEALIQLAREYFDRYGLLTIFVCALIEGMLFAGWYFPGSFIIVLGVFLAGDNYLHLFGVFAVTTVGLLLAYVCNFYLGKYGWYRLLAALGLREALHKAQAQLMKYGPRAIFFTFWHPNLAALTSTAAGILQMPLRTFLQYAIAATVLWDIFWTIIGFTLGKTALTLIGPQYIAAFIALWIALVLGKHFYTERQKRFALSPTTSDDVG